MEQLHRNYVIFFLCLAIKLEMFCRDRKSQVCRDLSKSFVDTFNVCSLELPVTAYIFLMYRSSLGNKISVTCFCNLFDCTLRFFLSSCSASNLHFLDSNSVLHKLIFLVLFLGRFSARRGTAVCVLVLEKSPEEESKSKLAMAKNLRL